MVLLLQNINEEWNEENINALFENVDRAQNAAIHGPTYADVLKLPAPTTVSV